MDVNILNELFANHFVLVVMVACLIIGYVIKHASFLQWINHNDIPVILAFVGSILNPIVGGFSVETVVYGALMGLASTGFHQAFTKFIERTNENKEINK